MRTKEAAMVSAVSFTLPYSILGSVDSEQLLRKKKQDKRLKIKMSNFVLFEAFMVNSLFFNFYFLNPPRPGLPGHPSLKNQGGIGAGQFFFHQLYLNPLLGPVLSLSLSGQIL